MNNIYEKIVHITVDGYDVKLSPKLSKFLDNKVLKTVKLDKVIRTLVYESCSKGKFRYVVCDFYKIKKSSVMFKDADGLNLLSSNIGNMLEKYAPLTKKHLLTKKELEEQHSILDTNDVAVNSDRKILSSKTTKDKSRAHKYTNVTGNVTHNAVYYNGKTPCTILKSKSKRVCAMAVNIHRVYIMNKPTKVSNVIQINGNVLSIEDQLKYIRELVNKGTSVIFIDNELSKILKL